MKDTILAYTAGLMGGEGTVGLVRHRANENRSPHVSVPSCTMPLLVFLQKYFGGNISTKRTYKKGHSPSCVWSLQGDSAIDFIHHLIPYLREPEKIRRARMLAYECKTITSRNGKYSSKQMKLKREFESRFFKYTRRRSVLVG